MRILVYPHDLGIGGSQLNAVELAGAVRDLGHYVTVFGRPGALNRRIAELDLTFVESPEPRRRPSPSVVRALRSAVATRGIDVVHGYEWPPALEARAAARGLPVVAVATVMSMAVAPFIPRGMPLAVGTAQIAAAEARAGRSSVHLLEPPVDVRYNSPDVELPVDGFRRQWQVDPTARTVVCVTRLATELKLEGVLAAMDAVEVLDRTTPTQLIVVGDGPARDVVERRAHEVNAGRRRPVVVLTGELDDPRPAYAIADVVLGMGGSALRALAFAKPLVVQGENGFWRTLTPDSLDTFLWTGWYGYGDGAAGGVELLVTELRALLAGGSRRRQLARFGRETVVERFSLETAAARQVAIYRAALSRVEPGRLRSDATATGRYAVHQARKHARRLAGTRVADDFNARPVAAHAATRGAGEPVVVYQAGVSWEAVVAGTDRHLATALSRHHPVVWVDPPRSWLGARHEPGDAVTEVAERITRVRAVGPPGVTRPGVRDLARRHVARRTRALITERGLTVAAVVASSPDPVLSAWSGTDVLRIYYATDDFVAGAQLLGCSARYLRRSRSANLRVADCALAVSSSLAAALSSPDRTVGVLPNGCQPDPFAQVPHRSPAGAVCLDPPIAGVVGQLNDRLDLALLEAVADTGDSLMLVGPRSEREPETTRRLDALLRRPNVQAVGAQPFAVLPDFLAAIHVGLTPYTDTPFNRASFPLKTLEYLAAGRPVVTSDLPGLGTLFADLVTPARGAADFAQAVHRHLRQPSTAEQVRRRQEFARTHSWQARGDELCRLIHDHRALRGLIP